MSYTQIWPRCGHVITGEDRDTVATASVEHARVEHGHTVTHQHVLAHLRDDNPDHPDR